jgi:hypothetical protein
MGVEIAVVIRSRQRICEGEMVGAVLGVGRIVVHESPQTQ